MRHSLFIFIVLIAAVFSNAKTPTRQDLIRELTGQEAWTDVDAYGRIIQLSRENKLREALDAVKAFEQVFPKSSLLAQVKIAQANVFVAQAKYGRAIAALDSVEKNEPQSLKMPAVILLKSQIYEKWGLQDLAREKKEQVIRRFAGSPESFQAGYSLKSAR